MPSIPDIHWERPPQAGLISVVTIVRNDRRGLLRTLESLDRQVFREFEHVVVDGASTDGTVDVLRQRREPQLRWSSEPDAGIADAFNKGLARTAGEWIQFLNAGDVYCDEHSLAKMAPRLGAPGIVTAFSRMDDKVIPARVLTPADPLRRRALISHQATLTHRQVFAERGGFDTELRVRMDYELWLRVLPHYPMTFLDEIITDYSGGGVSGSEVATFHREERIANRRYLEHPTIPNLRALLRPLWSRLKGRSRGRVSARTTVATREPADRTPGRP